MPKKRHFLGPLSTTKEGDQTGMVDGQQLSENEAELFCLLDARQYHEAIALIPSVENINAIDPKTGLTALHWGAGRGVRKLLEALWQRDDLDELACDARGRCASELAYVIADDEKLSRELMERERAYGEKTNQKPWPKAPKSNEPALE